MPRLLPKPPARNLPKQKAYGLTYVPKKNSNPATCKVRSTFRTNKIVERIKSVSPDKNAPVNLYCRSGRRAEVALAELKKAGYTNVTNHGGYEDLVKKGLK